MEESNYWTRLNRRRLSRRALLGAGATTALGAAAAYAVGCGGSGDGNGNGDVPTGSPRPSGSPGTPVQGGKVVYGRLLNILGVDPHTDLTGFDVDTLCYSQLYSWQPNSETALFNNLAESLEQPDPLTFIFNLRPGFRGAPVKDNPAVGEDLTAQDCIESFVRRGTALTAVDKRFPLKLAGITSPDAELLRAALQAPEPYIFRFTMAEPHIPALRDMASFPYSILHTKVIDKYGTASAEGLGQRAFGTGPFMLQLLRGQERVILKRNPDYYWSPRPWLDEIEFIIITDDAALLASFESGAHDVNGSVLTKERFDRFSKNEKMTTATAPSLFYFVMHMKVGVPPFDDIRVREAFNLAINRNEFIEVIHDGLGNFSGPIQWPQFKFALPQDELRTFYRYDPKRARELLDDYGLEPGHEITVKVPRVPGAPILADAASLLKKQLGEVGVNLLLDEVELGAFISSVILPGNFQIAFFPNLPWDEPDRPLSFYHSKGVTGSGNWCNYNNPELDKLIDLQAQQYVEEDRIKTILAAQRMILPEHGPQLTITGGYGYTARWSYVKLPFEFGQEPSDDAGPFGADVFTLEGL